MVINTPDALNGVETGVTPNTGMVLSSPMALPALGWMVLHALTSVVLPVTGIVPAPLTVTAVPPQVSDRRLEWKCALTRWLPVLCHMQEES